MMIMSLESPKSLGQTGSRAMPARVEVVILTPKVVWRHIPSFLEDVSHFSLKIFN